MDLEEVGKTEAPEGTEKINPSPPDKEKPKKILMAAVGAAVTAVICFVALLSTHVICFHSWVPATCAEPETCSICQKTQGEALGHNWAGANCTSPKTCNTCGETQGGALGHDVSSWEKTLEATCSQVGERQGTCNLCGREIFEEIPKLQHTEGDWIVSVEPIVNSNATVTPGERTLPCAVCGEKLTVEDFTIDLSFEQENALKMANSLLGRYGGGYSYSSLVEELQDDGYTNENAVFAADHCAADWNEQAAKFAKLMMKNEAHSRNGLIDLLRYRGFSTEQIDYALQSVGY